MRSDSPANVVEPLALIDAGVAARHSWEARDKTDCSANPWFPGTARCVEATRSPPCSTLSTPTSPGWTRSRAPAWRRASPPPARRAPPRQPVRALAEGGAAGRQPAPCGLGAVRNPRRPAVVGARGVAGDGRVPRRTHPLSGLIRWLAGGCPVNPDLQKSRRQDVGTGGAELGDPGGS